MKFIFVESKEKEEVIVYANKKNDLINSIEKLCNENNKVIGYKDNIIKELDLLHIECFYTSNDKIYAIYNKEHYLIKNRLYELYELYSYKFIYINQGCLVNLDFIDHFEVSIGGSLMIVLKSNYKDYVSRRKIKDIKERLGIK